MIRHDFIIVGSGIAGLYMALLARQYGSVLIITKGSLEETNTKHAQGGIAAAIGPADSPELHFQDTINAGAGLCDPVAVRILVSEAADRIADLITLGVPFDTMNGEIALTREAAHSMPRILHAGGDATGEHIEVTLSKRVRESRITVLEYCIAYELIVEKGRILGVRAFDSGTGAKEDYLGRNVILATGGSGRMFKLTTNSDVATADGIALAYQAGAGITDIEFLQFHPTALRLPGVAPFLISEAVRGEGGILRNVEGVRFMSNYAADGELALRDIVARAIVSEMEKTGSDRVFLDVTHLPHNLVLTRFPHIYQFCLDHGLDITRGLIPVAPAAHYLMGGVKTNYHGETNIRGLFACGETACTGVHGANRLASNSLLEVIVFAKRILDRINKEAATYTPSDSGQLATPATLCDRPPASAPPLSLFHLQTLMWEKIGIVRNGIALQEAGQTLADWQRRLPEPTDRPSYELNNMVLTGRMMAEAALIREESRGAHFRSDFPEPTQKWQRHIVFKRENVP